MIVVTGGAGFIGSAIVARLNESGRSDIIVVDELDRSNKWENLVHRQFDDLLDKQRFLELVQRGSFSSNVQALIHFGACSSTTEQDSGYLLENNYRYSKTLCEWAMSLGIRFIYASSAATYGDGSAGFDDDEGQLERLRPLNMYGYSKQLFDLWAKQHGVLNKIAGLKFFNVFGPNEYHKADMASVVYKAFGQIRKTGRLGLFKSYKPEFEDGEQRRDFVYVKDCAEIVEWLVNSPNVTGLYNVGSGLAASWNDLAGAIFSAMGQPAKIDYIEMPAAIRERYQYLTQANMAKLRAAGWTKPCTPLRDAIADYVTNYLSQADPYL